MSDPTLRGQPAHMQDFAVKPESDDHGGVHTNSGIHNFAAFKVLTSRDDAGGFLFSPVDVARLYYVTLVAHLSRTSDFADCREGMLLAAKSTFEDGVDAKVAAIEAAYDAVGIQPAGIV
jgi:Zn-dependent metalloprotease